MPINKNIFIHESDKAALAMLKAIPGFTQVLGMFMKVWNEENMHINNMAMKVRISENQLPEYYAMLMPICDKLGIDLMSKDEISVMDGSKCILQLRGVRSFFSDKYDLTKHPNFKLTADYDKKYTFDIEKYLNRRMKLKADDVYDVIEI